LHETSTWSMQNLFYQVGTKTSKLWKVSRLARQEWLADSGENITQQIDSYYNPKTVSNSSIPSVRVHF
jgi:hypothetical protein